MAKHVESDQRVPWHLPPVEIAGDRCPGPVGRAPRRGRERGPGTTGRAPRSAVFSLTDGSRTPSTQFATKRTTGGGASPEWTRRTYLADAGPETVGALVRTRTTHEDITVTQVADIVPLTGGEDWETAVSSLLNRAIVDHRDSDLLSIPEGGSAGDTAPTGISAGQPTPTVPVFGERFGSVCPAADGKTGSGNSIKNAFAIPMGGCSATANRIPFDPSERGCASRPSSEARPATTRTQPQASGAVGWSRPAVS